jgi:chromosome segregation ATPase
MTKAEREEADARFNAVNERLDRLFAPQSPIEASLEERVHELERQVVTLRRFLLLVSLQTSTSRKQALEQLDRALDQIDQIEEPEPGVRQKGPAGPPRPHEARHSAVSSRLF